MTMTVKAILAILTALFGCYPDRAISAAVQWSPDYPNCNKDPHQESFNLICTDSKNRLISMTTIDDWLDITHTGPSSIILEPNTFPKECLWSKNQTIRRLRMKYCTVPEGHNFGEFFEHLGIKDPIDPIQEFEGTNIGPSLDDLFSSGFERVENFTLRGNTIRQLNETVFRSMTNLMNLDLSGNQISTIDANVFKSLTKLKKLKLFRNQLKTLPEGMFESQKRLEVLLLSKNELQNLTMQTFSGLDSLIVLSIEKNQLSNLADNVFHNLPRLQQISLGNDKIEVPNKVFAKQSELRFVFLESVTVEDGLYLSGLEELKIKGSNVMNISGLSNITSVSILYGDLVLLADSSFKGLSGTKMLNLSSNNIADLVDGLFDGLKGLVHLHLSKNRLTNISGLAFQHLHNLIGIDLSDNRITTIHANAFHNTNKLETINLRNNQLSFSDNKLPFTHLYNLRTLNLNRNNLTRLPTDLTKSEKLKEVDVGFNQISVVKFGEIRHNFVNLIDNPLVCDCSMSDFLSGAVTRPDHEQFAKVFRHKCLKDSYQMVQCARETLQSVECPAECNCTETKNKADVHVLISCRGKELARVPDIKFSNATTIELDLSNNHLTELPMLHTNLNVTFIRASFNRISTITLGNIPPNLRGLDLSHNHVETIAANVVHHLKNHQTLEIFFLKHNPLACHCFSNDTVQFIQFVTDNSSITDLQGAKCNEHDELSMDVLDANCRKNVIIHCLVLATILTLIAGILSVLIIRHIEFIKMWLYANDWFLWWVDEEYVDRKKKYDVFISYANQDTDLALHLVQVLENCYLTYKFCEHERDFVGGMGIEQSVIDAVNHSRRIMVILSENYLQSEWCTHEFHLALERSLSEKRKIIIAVKYGPLGNVADADSVIGSYIKTHTYIESNDKWFWERILYALPHKKQKKNTLTIKKKDIENVP